ncbi:MULTISPECIES: Bug family tripartite tricarboxylate transporter substrate binding protein [Polaromonas]|uniref:Bug family tripartite tricarboxylate transporter substrate binding protein n=1 Tax=Polaromonas aquatica TaxID=332657 RepID=A0ABW1TYR3_9BURK
MKRKFIKTIASLAMTAAVFGAANPVSAQTFPDKPIRIVVPFAAGGSSDLLARSVARFMSDGLKVPVIVDNRPGAGGVIAMDAVAHAAPDGYTVLFATNGTHSIGPALYPARKIDPLKDLAPIGLLHTLPNILLVNPGVPAKNVSELIAYAKANPGKLNFASAGNGSASHLFGELFKISAGIDIVHVPYKGGGAAMPDLMAGQVSMMLETIPNAIPHVRSGKLNALAVTSGKRSSAAPEIPTVAESGIPGFDASSWTGLSAPAGTPKAIISILNAETVRIARIPAYLDTLKTMGTDATSSTPEAFDAYTRKDIAKWTAVVKKANVRVE